MADECKSKGLVDTVLADVMGFSQKETSEMFEISRSAISKRATGENQEEYDRLKTIMLEEAGTRGWQTACQGFSRPTETDVRRETRQQPRQRD